MISVVESALQEVIAKKMAVSYTELPYSEKLIESVANDYAEKAEAQATVSQFLYRELHKSEKLRGPSAFETEGEAEASGYYWTEDFDCWMWLPYDTI